MADKRTVPNWDSLLVVGWEQILPPILGAAANQLNVLLLGKHGTGKTYLGMRLGQLLTHLAEQDLDGHEAGRVVVYDCPKLNLITLGGLFDTDALRKGELKIVSHRQSVFDASVAVFDEITRARAETQNLLLEIVKEHTFLGIPLPKLKAVLATANPEYYSTAMSLDDSLLDRFHVILDAPDLEGAESGIYSAIAMHETQDISPEEMDNACEFLRDCATQYRTQWHGPEREGFAMVVGHFMAYLSREIKKVKGQSRGRSHAQERLNFLPPRLAPYLSQTFHGIVAHERTVADWTNSRRQDKTILTNAFQQAVDVCVVPKLADNLKKLAQSAAQYTAKEIIGKLDNPSQVLMAAMQKGKSVREKVLIINGLAAEFNGLTATARRQIFLEFINGVDDKDKRASIAGEILGALDRDALQVPKDTVGKLEALGLAGGAWGQDADDTGTEDFQTLSDLMGGTTSAGGNLALEA